MKIFLIFTAIFLLHQAEVFSCSCLYISPKDQYKNADIIFTGQVIEGPFYYGHEYHFKFAVSKFYKGEPADTIVVSTYNYSCSYNFKPGETYLVYAYSGAELCYTNYCTRTKLVKDAGIDIHFLNRLPKSLESSGIAGHVYFYENNLLNQYDLPPMGNYSFTLQSDSLRFLINCYSGGEFYADSIVPGSYTIVLNEEMDLHLKHSSRFSRSELQVEISDSSILEKTIVLSKKNTISGRFIDENEKPVSSKSVDLVPEIYFADNENRYKYERFDCRTDSTGFFKFIHIPDGRYYLGVNIVHGPRPYSPYSVTYYKNAANRASAQLIEVRNGSSYGDIRLKAGKTLKVYKVKGRIEASDSIFWRNASVELYKSAELKYNEKIESAGVSRGGTFKLDIMEGTEGWLVLKPIISMASAEKGIYPVTPEPVKIEPGRNYDNIFFKIETEKKAAMRPVQAERKSRKQLLHEDYKIKEFIFTGKILKMYPDTSDYNRYEIEVTKIFKGIKNDTLIVYYQSYPQNILESGREYLISGFKDGSNYIVTPSELKSIDEAGEDLDFLNAPPPAALVKGKVTLYENNMPLKNFSFTFHNLINDYKVETDSTGYYSAMVGPGYYEVVADKPSNLASYKVDLFFDLIEINEEDTLINQDLIFTTNNSVEGIVMDKNNKPLDRVRVDLFNYSRYKNETSFTDEDGRFIFSPVPDGFYNVGINIMEPPSAGNPYSVTRYKDEKFELKGGVSIRDVILIPDTIYKKQTIKGRVINTDGTPYSKGVVSLFSNPEGTELLSSGNINQRTGTFEVASLEYMEGWLTVSPALIDSGDERRWRPVKPEPFKIEAGRDYDNIELVIDPQEIEVVETIVPDLLPPERIIVPETIYDKKYFLPDEYNYKNYDSLKFLFKRWYVSDEIDYKDMTGVYEPVKSGDMDRPWLGHTFYSDGIIRFYYDSSPFVDLRWRMDIDNNSDIAIIAPNDTVMLVYTIFELKDDKLRMKADGYWVYSIQKEKIRITISRYTGREYIKTAEIWF
jgi:hypothetical protein